MSEPILSQHAHENMPINAHQLDVEPLNTKAGLALHPTPTGNWPSFGHLHLVLLHKPCMLLALEASI
jgi:hypothetical protein